MDFTTFAKDSNLLVVIIGLVVGQATLDMSKNFVSSLVMPILHALRTFKKPIFPVSNFVASVLTLGLAILVSFILVKAFRLQKKPLVPQPVMVTTTEQLQ